MPDLELLMEDVLKRLAAIEEHLAGPEKKPAPVKRAAKKA